MPVSPDTRQKKKKKKTHNQIDSESHKRELSREWTGKSVNTQGEKKEE